MLIRNVKSNAVFMALALPVVIGFGGNGNIVAFGMLHLAVADIHSTARCTKQSAPFVSATIPPPTFVVIVLPCGVESMSYIP